MDQGIVPAEVSAGKDLALGFKAFRDEIKDLKPGLVFGV